MRSARQTARTLGSPGCFASLRSVQGAAPLALLTQLSRRTLQKKQFALRELVSAIYVGAPDKSSGKRVQHIHIKYDGLGFIPLNELMKKETA